MSACLSVFLVMLKDVHILQIKQQLQQKSFRDGGAAARTGSDCSAKRCRRQEAADPILVAPARCQHFLVWAQVTEFPQRNFNKR